MLADRPVEGGRDAFHIAVDAGRGIGLGIFAIGGQEFEAEILNMVWADGINEGIGTDDVGEELE